MTFPANSPLFSGDPVGRLTFKPDLSPEPKEKSHPSLSIYRQALERIRDALEAYEPPYAEETLHEIQQAIEASGI